MGVREAVETRRAHKTLDPNHKMTDEEAKAILESAILSPTAFNIQNWRLVWVKDMELREKIREVAWGQEQVTSASMLLVICGDLRAWEKNPERYWRNSPTEVQEFILPAIHAYYAEKPLTQRDECMRSGGIITQSLMLLAEDMGYKSSPMDGFDYDAVGKLIGLPEDHIIVMMLAIGKPLKEAWPRGGQLPLDEVVIENRF
ncbi:MAG: nitroreductase family protein [Planctomycetes bacterium]|nr:nitroreductase family protein [Planctomycetota bacterium]